MHEFPTKKLCKEYALKVEGALHHEQLLSSAAIRLKVIPRCLLEAPISGVRGSPGQFSDLIWREGFP